MAKHLLHLRSSKVNTEIVDGVEVQKPSLPRPNQLENGEIAINYANDYERLSIKNSDGEIVTFLPDHVFLENKEIVDGEIEDLNNRLDEIGNIEDSLEDFKTETNGKFEALTQEIIDNEEVVSSALNDLNSRIDNIDIPDVSDELENLENQINGLTGTVTNINNTVTNLGDTVTGIGEDIDGIDDRLGQAEEEITNIKQTITNNEKVISSSLNDLNSRINDIDVPDVSDELENLQGQINTINNDTVPDLQSKIDENTRLITLNGQSLAETRQNLANVMETVGDGDFYDSPDDLLHRVAALESSVGGIDEIDDRLGQAEEEITNIKQTITDNEEVVSAALNDLNSRIDNIDVPSDITDELQNLTTQINTINNVTIPNVQEQVDENQENITYLMETVGNGDTYDSPDDLLHRVAALEESVEDIDEIKNVLSEDEKVISSSLNDLNSRLLEVSEFIDDISFSIQQKATISALNQLTQLLNDLTDRVTALENA